MKRIVNFWIVAAIVFAGIGFSGCNNQGKENKKKEIYIACNLPLTEDFASYGVSIRDGILFALDSLNNGNLKFDFGSFPDNKSTTKDAVTISTKQLDRNPDVYISGVKPQTMSIIDNISAKGIPHFVWIFDAFVTEKYKNTFRTWVNYKYEPIYYLKYIDKFKPKKIAIVYTELPHTDEEFQKIIIPELEKREIEVSIVEKYYWDKSDFKDIAIKIKNAAPDLIILNGFKGNLINLVKTFREQNLIHDGNTICTYDLLDAAEELSPAMLEGLRLVIPEFEVLNSEKLINWKKSFQTKFNRVPRYTDAYAYDMAYVIRNAIYSCGDTITNTSISKNILKTEFEGITGYVKFDATGDLILNLNVAFYKNGKLEVEIYE